MGHRRRERCASMDGTAKETDQRYDAAGLSIYSEHFHFGRTSKCS